MVFDGFLLSPLGLLALLAVVPVVVLYLIRPEPEELELPTLRFLSERRQQSSTSPILERLRRNVLLFVQLLVIALLALSLATPYVPVSEGFAVEETVLVVDGSASMATESGGETRFRRALSTAREEVTGTTSVVYAAANGRVLVNGGTRGDAEHREVRQREQAARRRRYLREAGGEDHRDERQRGQVRQSPEPSVGDPVGRGDDLGGGGDVALVSHPRAGVVNESDGRRRHRSVADRGPDRRPVDGYVRVRLDRRNRVRVRSHTVGEVRGGAAADDRDEEDDRTAGDRESPGSGESVSDPLRFPHGVGAAFWRAVSAMFPP